MSEPMSEAMVDQVVSRLAALADASRVRILHHLQGGEADIGTLVAATGVAQASVSKHVSILRQAGWVESRRQGTRVVVRIKDPAVYDLCRIVCDGVVRQAKEMHLELGLGGGEPSGAS